MKSLISVIGMVLLISAIAVPVLAHGPGWGRGGHMMGYGWGPGACWQSGPESGNLTEEQAANLDRLHQKFYDDTAKLRSDIWSKSRELGNLLNDPNPDSEKVTALQKEISDLKARMAQERIHFELEAKKIAPDARMGQGYGRGYGKGRFHGGYAGPRHMGGYGPGACWN